MKKIIFSLSIACILYSCGISSQQQTQIDTKNREIADSVKQISDNLSHSLSHSKIENVWYKRVFPPKEYISDGYDLIVKNDITDDEAKWIFNKIKNEDASDDIIIQLFTSENDFKHYCKGEDDKYKTVGDYELHRNLGEESIIELPSGNAN